ncbi:hypothetical protein DFP72DRAFT_1061728 [Ephemerocybe angulata]|uniref:Uncharacterized protein n=1 Tax=Ephemerocybe angulata TaxID=980116 RepID=A0A8H6I9N7_9AGAR|nr:hypothetical protein DFP72DRAFT_1061728 [Tulosesus angulatus]
MESRTSSLLLSLFLLFALLFTSPLVAASPLQLQPSSLAGRIAEELGQTLGFQRRDVIAPKITSPTASSVWPVGSTQTVTWDTSDFPPDNQITNPIGKVILGHDSGDSLNLDLQNPLAQGFKLRDGKVSVVVPNVPPRKDYLIVLMGDSGNTSPSFAITSISGGASNSTTSSSDSTSSTTTTTANVATTKSGSTTTTPVLPTAATITTPIPISGTTITGGNANANTTFPADTSIADSTSAAAPTTSSGQSVLNNAGTSQIGLSCWSLAIGFLVAGTVTL